MTSAKLIYHTTSLLLTIQAEEHIVHSDHRLCYVGTNAYQPNQIPTIYM